MESGLGNGGDIQFTYRGVFGAARPFTNPRLPAPPDEMMVAVQMATRAFVVLLDQLAGYFELENSEDAETWLSEGRPAR